MPKHPVFIGLSGGGVNGVAQVGAIIELQEGGVFEDSDYYMVGTSAGAFNLLGLALGFSSAEYLEFLTKVDFPQFLQTNGFTGVFNRFFQRFGAYSARYIPKLVNETIKKKTGLEEASFADLHQHDPSKHFFVIAANISKKGILTVFSHLHTPKIKVADAIQASMAVPFLYPPVRFKENAEGSLVKDIKGDRHIDGAVIDNFILHFFDSNKYVQLEPKLAELISSLGYNPYMLGIYLVDDEHQIDWIKDNKKPPSVRFNSIFQYAAAVAETICLRQKHEMLRNPIDARRTIFVNTLGNPPFDFYLNQEAKDVLLNSGREAAKKYLVSKKLTPEESGNKTLPLQLLSRL